MEVSLEKSTEEAYRIDLINRLLPGLDLIYLRAAYKTLRESHSRNDSMSILNPRPFLHNPMQELEAAKLKQLDLLIQLAENSQAIMKAESNVKDQTQVESELSKFFN
jgi:hypothetical protein